MGEGGGQGPLIRCWDTPGGREAAPIQMASPALWPRTPALGGTPAEMPGGRRCVLSKTAPIPGFGQGAPLITGQTLPLGPRPRGASPWESPLLQSRQAGGPLGTLPPGHHPTLSCFSWGQVSGPGAWPHLPSSGVPAPGAPASMSLGVQAPGLSACSACALGEAWPQPEPGLPSLGPHKGPICRPEPGPEPTLPRRMAPLPCPQSCLPAHLSQPPDLPVTHLAL